MSPDERKVRFAYDFVEKIATRDNDGNRLYVSWGEPDEDGFWTPTVTTDFRDNLAKQAAAAERTRIAAHIDAALDRYLPGSHPDLAQAIADAAAGGDR